MDYVVVEGLPAVGKSEVLALVARFYPESVRVLPELVKEVVERERIDLFRDRSALTKAIRAALPGRKARIDRLLDRGFLCLEESHLGVHRAYSIALGDSGFVDACDELQRFLPLPDACLRLAIPVARSVERQAARGTPGFEVNAATLERMLSELDRWHAGRSSEPIHIDADRPPHAVVGDLADALGLSYRTPRALADASFDVLLLLGRPASGKSEFIDFMARRPAAERIEAFHLAPYDVVDDFPILWERFEDDDLWERVGRPRLYSKRCDENYAVTDDALWSFLIEKINRRVEPLVASPAALARRTLIVEFSRGGPTGYADALERLSPSILARAAILYVSVSFEESWRRNVARYDEARRDGILTHSVPREEMQRSYGTDDWGTLAAEPHGILDVRGIRVPYATMHNEPESTDPDVLSDRYGRALRPLYDRWRRLGRSNRVV